MGDGVTLADFDNTEQGLYSDIPKKPSSDFLIYHFKGINFHELSMTTLD
ncbi:739_t:CDS:2 [Cetraspora pellucida]|uniref:739_t:CDS:1 n=1 Tax=Cetraspora pellucida TaxID=1433469 RepID=A0A9N9AP59_9GLOM|nr:739_t:CDS:2 [Cetraspora pellucida]